MVTGGDLLFTGRPTGEFFALDTDTGRQLWQFQTSSGINGNPITWMHQGRQYVTVLSGIGGLTRRFANNTTANVPVLLQAYNRDQVLQVRIRDSAAAEHPETEAQDVLGKARELYSEGLDDEALSDEALRAKTQEFRAMLPSPNGEQVGLPPLGGTEGGSDLSSHATRSRDHQSQSWPPRGLADHRH